MAMRRLAGSGSFSFTVASDDLCVDDRQLHRHELAGERWMVAKPGHHLHACAGDQYGRARNLRRSTQELPVLLGDDEMTVRLLGGAGDRLLGEPVLPRLVPHRVVEQPGEEHPEVYDAVRLG